MDGVQVDASNPDRAALLEELARANDLLAKENDLFEAFVERTGAGAGAGVAGEAPASLAPPGKRGAGAAPAHAPAPAGRLLSVDERYEVAATELELVQAQLERLRKDNEAKMDVLRSELEETDLSIQEVKRDTYEFKRDIVIGAENFRTGKTVAEKMLRYLEERLRQKEGLVEKLKLKNSSLKQQIHKMESQLSQKEEMGEVLHVIDFDQLKIENQQYLEKIEERNNELLRLKLTTGKTVQVLNKLKSKLSALETQSKFLYKRIDENRSALAKVEDEISVAANDTQTAQRANRQLKAELADTERPQVPDYMAVVRDVMELKKKKGDWLRKIEIARMERKRTIRSAATASTGMSG